MRKRLDPLIRAKPVLALRKPGTSWVEPSLRVEVEYLEISDDGSLRHSSFKRLAEK